MYCVAVCRSQSWTERFGVVSQHQRQHPEGQSVIAWQGLLVWQQEKAVIVDKDAASTRQHHLQHLFKQQQLRRRQEEAVACQQLQDPALSVLPRQAALCQRERVFTPSLFSRQ